MSSGSRHPYHRPYRRHWTGRALARDLIVVGWLALCGVVMQRYDLSATVTAWLFFGGGAILWAGLALGFGQRKTLAALRLAPRWRFPALVSGVAVAAFSVVLAWPSQDLVSPIAPTAASSGSAAGFACQVVSVHDGDTLRCHDGTRVRLHAVAARETDGDCAPGHPCPAASATAARDALVRLVGDQTIQCQSTGRSYGRVTAICWTPAGVEINCAMVESGTTLVWPRFHAETPICSGRLTTLGL